MSYLIFSQLSLKWIIVRAVQLRYLCIFSYIQVVWLQQSSLITRCISPTKYLTSCHWIMLWTIYLPMSVLSQKLVDAFRKIPRASWSGKDRFVISVGSLARYFHSTAKLDAFCETHNVFVILLYLIFPIFRLWMLPPASLSTAEEVLRAVPGLAVEVLLYLCTLKKCCCFL